MGLGCVLVCGGGDEARERERRAVDAGHEEAAEDDFVEGGVGAACVGCEGGGVSDVVVLRRGIGQVRR